MSKEPVFESILEHDGAGFTYFRRHASSLNLRLLVFVFGSLAAFSAVIAAGFAMAGAWLIIPFAGVEIAALGAAAYVILRRAGDFERLVFSGDHILVEVRERGLARQFEFHRGWARLVTGETGSVALRSHGRTVEIGRYCCAEGRRVLAQELRGRLGSKQI
ncbi:MAG: DUF2244 domain-containing protein [Betaproteobacteria bacterium]